MRARGPLLLLLLACAGALAVGAGAASAASGPATVISDCQAHGKLTKTYSVTVLHNALIQLPADISQYSDCADVITKAERAALGSGQFVPAGGAGSGGGSFLPTWVIVLLVVVALGGVTLVAVAVRRRRAA